MSLICADDSADRAKQPTHRLGLSQAVVHLHRTPGQYGVLTPLLRQLLDVGLARSAPVIERRKSPRRKADAGKASAVVAQHTIHRA